MASTPDAPAGQQPLERTDQPHEVKPPQIVRDYYPNIPPTAQDRYLARDQSNPVPIFDSSPNRDQAVQGRVGDCGIVATLGAVAEHRPEAIKEAIKQVGDGAYEITLHEITEAGPADPVARPTGEVKTYRVNDELPVRTDHPSRPPAGMQAESCGWPALTEKVIAAEDQTWDTAEKADWDHKWTAQHKPMVDPGQQQGEQALLAAFGDEGILGVLPSRQLRWHSRWPLGHDKVRDYDQRPPRRHRALRGNPGPPQGRSSRCRGQLP
jgi:hypothetical protein